MKKILLIIVLAHLTGCGLTGIRCAIESEPEVINDEVKNETPQETQD